MDDGIGRLLHSGVTSFAPGANGLHVKVSMKFTSDSMKPTWTV